MKQLPMYSIKTIAFSFFLISIQFATAQDIHFSQFYNTPVSLNPALVGSMDSDIRINLNLRNQWSSILRGDGYKTGNLTVDKKLNLKNGDAIGVGLNGIIDRAGALSFGTTQGLVSFSYHKNIGRDSSSQHTISIGTELGVVQRRIDFTNARWPSQHNSEGGFDPTNPGPFINDNDFFHGDINIGINWSTIISNTFSFSIGAAAHHINKPNVTFQDSGTSSLNIRYAIHGQVDWGISSKMHITPRFRYQRQGPHNQLITGVEVGRDLGKQILSVGGYIRSNNGVSGVEASAFISTLSLKYDRLALGLSYDLQTNDLRQAGTAVGALELTTTVLF